MIESGISNPCREVLPGGIDAGRLEAILRQRVSVVDTMDETSGLVRDLFQDADDLPAVTANGMTIRRDTCPLRIPRRTWPGSAVNLLRQRRWLLTGRI